MHGTSEARPLDNVGALDLREIPKRLIVIGGGVIGMELGAFYSEIGSDVTVLEMLPLPLAGSDPELVKLVEHDTRLRDQAVPDWRGGALDWINRIAALVALAVIAVTSGPAKAGHYVLF